MTDEKQKQKKFNEISGCIAELNDSDKYCNITILVGHQTIRPISLSIKKTLFDEVIKKHSVGDIVTCRFFLSSNKKGEKWFTNANILSIE
jgi:hypothetical protein